MKLKYLELILLQWNSCEMPSLLFVTYISDVQVGFRLGNGAGHTIVGTANQT